MPNLFTRHVRVARVLGARALFIGLIAHVTHLYAATAPMNMEAAVQQALERQPRLMAQETAIHGLMEEAMAAGQLPDPRLSLGLMSLPLDTFSFTQEPMTQAVIGLSQMIPGGNKRQAAGERLRREAEQMRHEMEAKRLNIAQATRLAWLDAYQPGAMLELVERLTGEYGRQVEWSGVAYKTGQTSQEETLAARVMLEGMRDRAAELRQMQRRARVALARWVGEAALEQPLDALDDEPPPRPLGELEAALGEHPELRMQAQAVAVAGAAAEEARQAYKPDIGVDLAYGLRGGGETDFVSLVVSMDLPVFTANRQDRRLAARLADVGKGERMLEDRRLELLAELRAAYADWRGVQERMQAYERDILPLAVRRVESALAGYGAGKLAFERVLEARRGELEARLAWLNLRVERARAAARLKFFGA